MVVGTAKKSLLLSIAMLGGVCTTTVLNQLLASLSPIAAVAAVAVVVPALVANGTTGVGVEGAKSLRPVPPTEGAKAPLGPADDDGTNAAEAPGALLGTLLTVEETAPSPAHAFSAHADDDHSLRGADAPVMLLVSWWSWEGWAKKFSLSI